MSNQERQIRSESGFDRESMDPETPHGKAQAKFDEMVETAINHRTEVFYRALGEPLHPLLSTNKDEVICEAPVMSNDHKIVGSSEVDGAKIQKPKKTPRIHNTTGLNGFYKGTFYRDGNAQRPKNRRRK